MTTTAEFIGRDREGFPTYESPAGKYFTANSQRIANNLVRDVPWLGHAPAEYIKRFGPITKEK